VVLGVAGSAAAEPSALLGSAHGWHYWFDY
jgi:hypothetical protein